ncbi:MAG: GNAT family N-acetyltransferase [Shimia sp.]
MVHVRETEPYLLDVPVPIRTPRLVLRPPRAGDGSALAEAMGEAYDTLHPWFHAAMGSRQRETSAAWQNVVTSRAIAAFVARERLTYLTWEGEALIGIVELKPDWRVGRQSLSYWLRPGHTRRGLGREAVGAVVRHAFDALDARFVTVSHAAPNARSAKLIAALGFERTAHRKLDYEMPDGTLVDEIGYTLSHAARLPAQDVTWGADRVSS